MAGHERVEVVLQVVAGVRPQQVQQPTGVHGAGVRPRVTGIGAVVLADAANHDHRGQAGEDGQQHEQAVEANAHRPDQRQMQDGGGHQVAKDGTAGGSPSGDPERVGVDEEVREQRDAQVGPARHPTRDALQELLLRVARRSQVPVMVEVERAVGRSRHANQGVGGPGGQLVEPTTPREQSMDSVVPMDEQVVHGHATDPGDRYDGDPAPLGRQRRRYRSEPEADVDDRPRDGQGVRAAERSGFTCFNHVLIYRTCSIQRQVEKLLTVTNDTADS
jgi:hypothetical protein